MQECYDRANERKEFTISNKDVLIFLNSQGNGMSTFLYNILSNKQYIFIRENYKNDIVFDMGDKDTSNLEKAHRDFLDISIDALQQSKIALNLFYFTELGTFFRNLSVEIANYAIRKLNNRKYSFENFLDNYISYCENNGKGAQFIYIIIDHADNCSGMFYNKVRSLLSRDNIKIIICLNSPTVKAEISSMFNDYDKIDFSKPSFENAKIIFDNLNFDSSVYDLSMYNNSRNIFDFIAKYQEQIKAISKNIDPTEELLDDILSQIKCRFSKKDFQMTCRYLVCNSYVDKNINSEEIFNQYLKNKKIINSGTLYSCLSNHERTCNIAFNEIFLGLASYLLNSYSDLSYNFLFYLFHHCKEKISFECKILIYLLKQSDSITEITELIGNMLNNRSLTYAEYLNIIDVLFEKKLYNLLFVYPNSKKYDVHAFDQLLQLIIYDKKHMAVNTKSYKKALIKCLKLYQNIDIQCLLVILYLDFCINHDKKQIKKFISPKNKLFYNFYSNSKYYYILESIVAYYLNDENMSLDLYNESMIGKEIGVKTYLLNNKIVFLLRCFINEDRFNLELKESILDMYDLDCDVNDDKFLNTNILLYKSISSHVNQYSLHEFYDENNKSYRQNLPTWDIYKILNAHILDFMYSSNFKFENYKDLERIVLKSNRAPTKNIYYYNYFVMASFYDNKIEKKKAMRFLDHNKDFYYSNIKDMYNSIKVKDVKYFQMHKKKLVRFGYIFSRIIELNYLFKEIAVSIK